MQRRTFLQTAAGSLLASAAHAGTKLRRIDTQFIAALGGPGETSGHNAQKWGLWAQDPGPRGVWLTEFPAMAKTGIAPEGWTFDRAEWWMEEHGLIMEKPAFPLAAGQYVVTGGRKVTTVLTVGAPDAAGAQDWALADGVMLEQVTHLACRSARYTSQDGASCSPAQAQQTAFPVSPGAVMPPVDNCVKQDYAVLFVIGMMETV